jgi:hypothetical protein
LRSFKSIPPSFEPIPELVLMPAPIVCAWIPLVFEHCPLDVRDFSCNVDLWFYVFDALFIEGGVAMAGSHRTTKKSTLYTLVGALIHRLRIGELAQLPNILRGEMSFVGPRPSGASLPSAARLDTRRERRLAQRRCQPERRSTLRWYLHGGDRRHRFGRRKDEKWDMMKG